MIARNKKTGEYWSVKGFGRDSLILKNGSGETRFDPINFYDIIELSKELIRLFGIFFPVKVPRYIIENGETYRFFCAWVANDRIQVGYVNDRFEAHADLSVTSDSERKARKELASLVKNMNIDV